jgi:hypothetical protein
MDVAATAGSINGGPRELEDAKLKQQQDQFGSKLRGTWRKRRRRGRRRRKMEWKKKKISLSIYIFSVAAIYIAD